MNQKLVGVLMIALAIVCFILFPEDGTGGVFALMLGICALYPEKTSRKRRRRR